MFLSLPILDKLYSLCQALLMSFYDEHFQDFKDLLTTYKRFYSLTRHSSYAVEFYLISLRLVYVAGYSFYYISYSGQLVEFCIFLASSSPFSSLHLAAIQTCLKSFWCLAWKFQQFSLHQYLPQEVVRLILYRQIRHWLLQHYHQAYYFLKFTLYLKWQLHP